MIFIPLSSHPLPLFHSVTHNPPRFLPPAKRNWRDAVVLAPRSGTGLRKQTGDSLLLVSEANSRMCSFSALTGSYPKPTTHNLPRCSQPAKRNWRDAVVLAPRSGTGLRKQTGDSRPLLVFLPLIHAAAFFKQIKEGLHYQWVVQFSRVLSQLLLGLCHSRCNSVRSIMVHCLNDVGHSKYS